MKKRVMGCNELEVSESDSATEIKIITKCPRKWLIVDLQSYEAYIYEPNERGMLKSLTRSQNLTEIYQSTILKFFEIFRTKLTLNNR